MTYGKKIVFITSLERSGSTLLDISLSRHPDLVSFGEVARVLLPHCGNGMAAVVGRLCSCGSKVSKCQFWGPVTSKIRNQESSLSLYNRYQIFLDHFNQIYGPSKIPVDSSKFISAMEALIAMNQVTIELKLLFIIRDVRGWSKSSKESEKRKREIPYNKIFSKNFFSLWKPYLRHNILRHVPFWLPFEWYHRNLNIKRFISQKKLSVFNLSYEMLALNTDQTLLNLHAYLEVEPGLEASDRQLHIVRGNRMAFDPAKNKSIYYDNQWLSDVWVQYESMAWPFIMKKNRDWVYK